MEWRLSDSVGRAGILPGSECPGRGIIILGLEVKDIRLTGVGCLGFHVIVMGILNGSGHPVHKGEQRVLLTTYHWC